MTTYKEIKDVRSDVEPKEEVSYGAHGVDYNINIRPQEDGSFLFDTLRFDNVNDYIRYRKLHD